MSRNGGSGYRAYIFEESIRHCAIDRKGQGRKEVIYLRVADISYHWPQRYVAPAGAVLTGAVFLMGKLVTIPGPGINSWTITDAGFRRHRMSKRLFQNMPKCPLICLVTVRRTFHHTARSLFTQNGFRIWSLFTTHTSNPHDEDCLKLNVWTKTPKAKAKKPVFIWFHGGRFTIPSSYSPFYNSQYLSNTEDVVVVTPNYRSGIFGFSGAPGIEQNAALLNYYSVVERVRDNIVGTSANPFRIVIFGQSAGGTAAPALPTKALAHATFHPTIDNIVVFDNYKAMSVNCSILKIPYLLANADYGRGWYKLSAYAAKINLTHSQWDLFNQRAFTCPTGEEAKYRVQYEIPTYLRLYNGSAGLGSRRSSVYHGTDLDMINTAEEDATSEYMVGAWAAFARDPAKALIKYGWPSYSENSTSLVRLAYNNSAKPNFVNPAVYEGEYMEASIIMAIREVIH
ncbi:alpha/beta-hydrolase [Cenococcum geophilum]